MGVSMDVSLPLPPPPHAGSVRIGVTPPISSTGPVPEEVFIETALSKFLLTQGGEVSESDGGDRRRKEIITKLENIVKGWVASIASEKKIEFAEDGAGARLAEFGSQRLGYHNASDFLPFSLCPFTPFPFPLSPLPSSSPFPLLPPPFPPSPSSLPLHYGNLLLGATMHPRTSIVFV